MNIPHKISIVLVALLALFQFSCKRSNAHQATQTPTLKTAGQESASYSRDKNAKKLIFDTVVEIPPLFNNKDPQEEFRNYVDENFKMPLEYYIDGSFRAVIYVEFSIDTDGSVTDVKILRGFDTLLDAETLRVINSSPKWTPAQHDGKPVKVKCVFPVELKY